MNTQLALTPEQKQLKELVRQETTIEKFRNVLGEKQAPAFLASVLSAVNENNMLSQCDPVTVLNAAMKAAVLDLPVENNLGHAWLIPYHRKLGASEFTSVKPLGNIGA